jgi:S-adenosylmethionine/arginine decarboxylase-like enzyme
MIKTYGKELILDLHDCDSKLFTRENITKFFIELCDSIEMERCDLHFWDDLATPEEEKETESHLKGTSAIQFIKTSNITIHTLDILESIHLNIFSCKEFDTNQVIELAEYWFKGKTINQVYLTRI